MSQTKTCLEAMRYFFVKILTMERLLLKRYIHRQNDELVQLFLSTQEQLESIDSKLQLVLEQLAVANSKRFGRSSEKMAPDNQIAVMEVDGKIVFFNEAEAVAAITEYDENEPVKQRSQTILNHTIILNICCQKSQIIWMTRI